MSGCTEHGCSAKADFLTYLSLLPLINSKDLLSAYFVPGIVLGAEGKKKQNGPKSLPAKSLVREERQDE